MKSKNIVTAILLAFVVVSVAVLLVRESRGPAEPNTSTQSAAVPETALSNGAVAVKDATNSTPPLASAQAAKIPAETGSVPAKAEQAKPATSSRAAENVPASPKVVVYYFHGNTRCITCRKIESFAKSAIEGGFAAQLKKGQIRFQAVNVEEPENEHFVQDYQLATRSVVLSRIRNDRQDAWKNLDQVWTLVRDPEAFQRYVVEETKQMLGGA
ncbi:MAG: nitrophenyl compound nitroreductase subunit ArsF family protein [Geobacteraceae bacterium]